MIGISVLLHLNNIFTLIGKIILCIFLCDTNNKVSKEKTFFKSHTYINLNYLEAKVNRKKSLSVLILGAVLLFSLFLLVKNRNSYSFLQEKENLEATGSTKLGVKIEDYNKNMAYPYDPKSGPISVLPWENEEKFRSAINDTGNLFLLAAYHTVLKDPLPGEEENVHLAAKMLAGITLEPGQVFSQNSRIGPYNEARGFKRGPTYIGSQLTTTIGGGVCKIASTLYNVAILSDLGIIERHAHGMPVPYVPHGQDATVA